MAIKLLIADTDSINSKDLNFSLLGFINSSKIIIAMGVIIDWIQVAMPIM